MTNHAVVFAWLVLAAARDDPCSAPPCRGRAAALARRQSAGRRRLDQIEPCPDAEKLPPADSPVLRAASKLRCHPVNETIIDAIDLPATTSRRSPSIRSQDQWVPYNEDGVQADFWNLWRTNFLDNLWVEVIDEPYENGVIGKHVIFHIEERPRVKVVDYVPATDEDEGRASPRSKRRSPSSSIEVRLDTFVDEATIRRVKGVIRELYAEQGYNDAAITTELTPAARAARSSCT